MLKSWNNNGDIGFLFNFVYSNKPTTDSKSWISKSSQYLFRCLERFTEYLLACISEANTKRQEKELSSWFQEYYFSWYVSQSLSKLLQIESDISTSPQTGTAQPVTQLRIKNSTLKANKCQWINSMVR